MYEGIVRRFAPYALFFVMLVWRWSFGNPLSTVPAYGDVLEIMWAVEWLADTLPHIGFPPVAPMSAHPEGWFAATGAMGMGQLLTLWLLQHVFGFALAYNLLIFGALLAMFTAALHIGRRIMPLTQSTVVSLLITFWGANWVRIGGHTNQLVGMAVCLWILNLLERKLPPPSPPEREEDRSPPFRGGLRGGGVIRTAIICGILWAFAVTFSFYYLWLCGLLILLWVVGRWRGGFLQWKDVWRTVIISGGTMLTLAAPFILLFQHGQANARASGTTLNQVVPFGLNVNLYPLPFLWHPLLGQFTQRFIPYPISESELTSVGIIASLLALSALPLVWREKRWRTWLLIGGVMVVLALGPFLKWGGTAVQHPTFAPLTGMVWRTTRQLKPTFVIEPEPPKQLDGAIPLPWLGLAAFVPFWEGARTVSRFATISTWVIFLLAGWRIAQIRWRWVQWILMALLLFEGIPHHIDGVPYPPPAHEAHLWLEQNGVGGVIDLHPETADTLNLQMGGEPVWSTTVHRQPAVSVIGSVWPGHVSYMLGWLKQTERPLQHPHIVPLMQQYDVTHILLHKRDALTYDPLADVEMNSELVNEGCFAGRNAPWDDEVCIVAVRPTSEQNNLLREGNTAIWIGMQHRDHQLDWTIQPDCTAPFPQTITLTNNGQPFASHEWQMCKLWEDSDIIPSSAMLLGPNRVEVDAAVPVQMAEFTINHKKNE